MDYSNNMFREKLEIRFVCSVCGEKLKFTLDEDEKLHCNDAYNVYINKKIEPCRRCIEKANKPLRKLKEALGLISDV